MRSFDDVCFNCGDSFGEHFGEFCNPSKEGMKFEPVKPQAKWLDAPNEDGIWLRAYDGEYKESGRVIDGAFVGQPLTKFGSSKWFYMGPIPPDPVRELPKSLHVILTANVCRTESGRMWRGSLSVPGHFEQPKSIVNESLGKCIEWCRSFGIEPVVTHD